MANISIFTTIGNALYEELDSIIKGIVGDHPVPCVPDFGCPTPDDIKLAACRSLKASFGKKFSGEPSGSHTERLRPATLLKFLRRNSKCNMLNRELFSVHGKGYDCFSDKTRVLLGEATAFLSDVLQPLDDLFASDAREIGILGAVGSGVAVGSDDNDLYGKLFESPLIAPSEGALNLWQIIVASDQTLLDASWMNSREFGQATVLESAARWDSVSKSTETNRTIVIPSNLGSFLARSVGVHLERVLARLGFDIQTQPERNRKLAQIGSNPLVEDELFRPATIDLTDASDSLYVELVRHLLQHVPNVLKALECCRDKACTIAEEDMRSIGYEVDAVHHETLHMFSTMGNGFTFPLQTLIFLSFVHALMKLRGMPRYRHLGGEVRCVVGVFGDDIIVPCPLFDDMVEFLLDIGLEPNRQKSFGTGWFKESCGADWLYGHDIRGVYCKTVDTQSDLVSLFNRLVKWSAKTEIPIHGTLGVIYSLIEPAFRNAVPVWEDDHAGIRIPESMCVQPVWTIGQRIRFGIDKDDLAYLPYRPSKASRDITKSERVVIRDGFTGDPMAVAVEFVQYGDHYKIDDAYIAGRTARMIQRDLFVTRRPDALLLCFVAGAVSGRSVPKRSYSVRYNQHRICVTHCWDTAPALIKQGRGGVWIAISESHVTCGSQSRWSSHLLAVQRVLSAVPGFISVHGL